MAAENNAADLDGPQEGVGASMRPRRMAAENSPTAFAGCESRSSFNEAAAHGRGKQRRARHAPRRDHPASMRPRRMAAENFPLF